MAQAKSIASLAAFLLLSALTPHIFAMEPVDSSAAQPEDQAASEQDKQIEAVLSRANLVNEEAEAVISQGKERYPSLNTTASPSSNIDAHSHENAQRKSPEFPPISRMSEELDNVLPEDFLKVETPQTNLFGDAEAASEPKPFEPIEVTVEETGFPNPPRLVVVDTNSADISLPVITDSTEAPAQQPETPTPTQTYDDRNIPFEDINHYLQSTEQNTIPTKAPEPEQADQPQPPIEQAPAPAQQQEHPPVQAQQNPQPEPQQNQQQMPLPQTQPAHQFEESTIAQILENIKEHKVPMFTAGAFAAVHWAYENEILANAVTVRSPKMCEVLHDYVLPTAREALAAHLIQLLIPYLPYLNTKNIRSYSTSNYLACFIATKILGSTALYLAKLATETEHGKKLITHYKELPKTAKETIEKVMPWLMFGRNVLVARSMASYFE